MDLDDDVRAAVNRPAEPCADGSAFDDLADRPHSRTPSVLEHQRVRLTLLGAALAVLVAVAVPVLISRIDRSSPITGAPGEGWVVHPSKAMTSNPGVGGGGVLVGIDAEFDQTRVVTSGRISGANQGGSVEFTPRDGTDNDVGYPVPLTVPDGITVGAQAVVLPDCGANQATAPLFVVKSRDSQGTQYSNTAPVAATESWQAAATKWCAMDVQVLPLREGTELNGDQYKILTLTNPGPQPVTVLSEETLRNGRGWNQARVEVPPAATKELTIHGTRTRGLPPAPVLVDGEPVDTTQRSPDVATTGNPPS